MQIFALFTIVVTVLAADTVAIKIDCFFDLELLFDELKVAYTCTVLKLVTNITRRDVSEVKGNHTMSNTDQDITQLYIINQQMEYFPRGFTIFFENIVAIHAGMNKLKYLESNDLKEFTKIRFLYLYTNLLQVLQSDVFQHSATLEYVSFYNNHLIQIGSRILQPLKRCKTAFFNKNICIDKQAVASEQGISELRLEIAERCSDITDEDLMGMLKVNQMKMSKLEAQVEQISEQLSSVVDILKSFRIENTTD